MFEFTVVSVVYGLLAIVALAGIVIMFIHVNMSTARKGEPLVRWSWIPFLGWAIEMGIRPVELLQESAEKYGEIFGLVVAGNRMFFINDCHSAHILFRATPDLSWVEFQYTVMSNFFGTDLKTMLNHVIDEDLMRKWYHMYILSDDKLHHLTLRLQKRMRKDFNSISSTTQVPLFEFVSKLIFKASIAAFLNDAAADDDNLYYAFLAFDKQLPVCAAGIDVKHFAAAFKGRQNLLDALAKYTDDNSEFIQVRRKYFRDVNVSEHDAQTFQLAIFWASVGNTMPTSFWLIYYLMCQPDLMAQAKQEVKEAFESSGDDGSAGDLSQDAMNRMVFIDACISETMRLVSGSILLRYVRRPCEVTLNSGNTYKFRKGDRLGLCPALIHHDEEIYSNAQSFVPSRWIKGSTLEEQMSSAQGKIPMYKGGKEIPAGSSYLPFAYGATYCPGRKFARNELKTLIAMVLHRYNFSFIQPDPATGRPSRPPVYDGTRAGVGIFPPKDDLLVNISLAK